MSSARVVVLKPGETPNIAINLLESPSSIPGVDGDGKGEHGDKHPSMRLISEEAQHPGSAAGHVTGEIPDRVPGYGGHQPGQEPHHLGNIPDNTRRLPSHVLDPNVKSPMQSEPGHLGLPHTEKESDKEFGGQHAESEGQQAHLTDENGGADDGQSKTMHQEQPEEQYQNGQQVQNNQEGQQHANEDTQQHMNQSVSQGQHASIETNPMPKNGQ